MAPMGTLTSTPHATASGGELALLTAIFLQAQRDLAAGTPPHVQRAARQFWLNELRDLEALCELAGLEWRLVQRRMCARHPEILAPRQLDLALGATR
jgi:hypothetical protein